MYRDPGSKRSQIMEYFAYSHLPKELQAVSEPFYALALRIETNLPASDEKQMALRKLLEAKDCAVRASL